MSFNFIKFYNTHKLTIYFVGAIILFIVLFFIDRKKEYGKYKGINPDDLNRKKKWIWRGKTESKCRNIIEKYFNKPFNKIRPDFLKYTTGHNLELDMYNEELKLACEYNGIQHAKFSPFFHKSQQDFVEQQNRDNFKKLKCEQLGIKLITIPHTVKSEDLENYIYGEIKKLNL